MKIRVQCPDCGSKRQVLATEASREIECRRCGRDIALALTQSVGEDLEVDACPVCEGQAFYVRKDLNRNLGLGTVVIVSLISAAFLYRGQDLMAYGVLGALALIDLVVYQLLTFVTVCYRCQAEFRGSYRRTAPLFDLHLAEKWERDYSRQLDAE